MSRRSEVLAARGVASTHRGSSHEAPDGDEEEERGPGCEGRGERQQGGHQRRREEHVARTPRLGGVPSNQAARGRQESNILC